MPVAVRRKTRNSCARTSKHCRRTVNFQKIGRSESEQVQVPQVGEPDSPSNCRKANPPHTCRPTPNIWLRTEDRIIGPEHRAGRGIIEAHGGSASSDEWDETARRINQKIQNNEQLTVEEQACVIETPKVRNAKKLCQQVGDQYTYQNNNAMVDYFDTDGYVTVQAVTGIKKPENIE